MGDYTLSEVILRNLKIEDIVTIYQHIHSEYMEKYYSNNLEEQQGIYEKWYKYMIVSPGYRPYFFDLEKDDKSKDFLAFINYELKNNRAIVNIYINKKYRGLDYGKLLLKMSMDKLKKDTKKIKFIVAYILEENLISQKTFLGAGFNFKKIEKNNKIRYKLYRRYL